MCFRHPCQQALEGSGAHQKPSGAAGRVLQHCHLQPWQLSSFQVWALLQGQEEMQA